MEKVVIVNGTTELLDLVQPVLTAGRYDVVFVESSAHAYSQIKRERPSLVILCLDMQERDGFDVLSMLKLDEDTRAIPLLTCLSEYELPHDVTAIADSDDSDDDAEILEPLFAASMN